MKIIHRKIKRAKKYLESLYHEDNFALMREELFKDVKAAVFLSLSEAIIKKYIAIQDLDNKTKSDREFLTREEFTEFVAFVCIRLQSESGVNDLTEKSKV
tara:strand:- start:3528 stop:3827 length:300 start_codon:yes stop_codon:yes gene_type:complete